MSHKPNAQCPRCKRRAQKLQYWEIHDSYLWKKIAKDNYSNDPIKKVGFHIENTEERRIYCRRCNRIFKDITDEYLFLNADFTKNRTLKNTIGELTT